MPEISYPNPKADLTVRVFDNFYNYVTEVPANQYDTIFGYFLTMTNNRRTANTFTTAVFKVADTTEQDVMAVFQSLQGQDYLQLTATLAYFLNGLRSPSALYGVSVPITPNFYAARNVLL